MGTYLVGSVRIGPAEAEGGSLLVLGPLTVDPSFSDRGIGTRLMQASLDAARAAGHGLVVLVGDAPYYARFGFKPVPPAASPCRGRSIRGASSGSNSGTGRAPAFPARSARRADRMPGTA
ncbi:hypothetical protein GCM10025880_30740 [Methylorubrum aminovorans]|nr:hypothetical protein GCM10025880_30740 [Methylorubrum aminovorans]